MEKAQRLDKILSMSGYGTRKEVKKLVKQGSVTVNGAVASDSGSQVVPGNDDIRVFGKALDFYTYVYIMMNKPQGVLSSTRDGRETTVIDLLDGAFSHRKLFPAGRLDKDSEGLVLLTDDGTLAHRLLSPKRRVPKVYYVEAEGMMDEGDAKAFRAGIDLGDFIALPAELTLLGHGDAEIHGRAVRAGDCVDAEDADGHGRDVRAGDGGGAGGACGHGRAVRAGDGMDAGETGRHGRDVRAGDGVDAGETGRHGRDVRAGDGGGAGGACGHGRAVRAGDCGGAGGTDVSRAYVRVVEGKFHQVKRMVEARGKQVTYLKRMSLGTLQLDDSLNPGEWRELTEAEIRKLRD